MKVEKHLKAFALLTMLLLLCSCGLGAKKSIVGKWESSTEKGVFYNTIEFFSDGTQVTEHVSWSGTYTTDGNRLRISGKPYSEVFSFELSNNGNQLTLINSLGHSKIYKRVN